VASAVASLGNRRHHHAVLGATDPGNVRDDEHLGASEVEGSPATFAARVVAGTAILTVRASPTMFDSRSQSDLEALVDDFDTFHSDALGVDTKGPG
jgi:hypothetical protein